MSLYNPCCLPERSISETSDGESQAIICPEKARRLLGLADEKPTYRY
jgi:hypothetical protein